MNTINKTAHTEGPWTINSVYQTLVDAPSGICGGSRLICSTEVGNKNGDAYDWQIDQQNAANARLIAAAPDLLEIAQRWRDWSQAGEVKPVSVRMKLEADTCAAISKAEGAQ